MQQVKSNEKKDCFIICPIGKSGSDIRERSNTLLKFVFDPVLSKHNYYSIRADKIPKAGMITSQIINLILEAPLVIADLTGGNPNVFYELALRHASLKPFIQIVEKGDRIPFDISGVRTIEIDLKDINSIDEAKKDLDSQITEIDSGHIPDSPYSTATNVKLLQSDSEVAESLLQKLDLIVGWGWHSIDDVVDKIDNIENKLDDISEEIIDKIEVKIDETKGHNDY